jgi:crotonobetainyl-CoA:carnitine CoA-transferase CaiB-like acyl-CoA transferase
VVIGEHTREVLGEIGLARAAITALEAAAVVRAAAATG